jgi:cellulose synthase/poly-beta-1,6-N-acetylglucosamine synthase-like glycosyltransferase
VKGLFWASLAVIAYTYAGYPLAMGMLAKLSPWPWKRAAWPEDKPQPISVVMAVHNGAAMLGEQLEHLLGLDVELVREVIAVCDGSTDGTAAMLLAAAAKEPRLKAIVLEAQGGKAAALRHGIAAAQGEIVLFVDIRPRIAAGALAELLTNFADERVGCVAGELVLNSEGLEGAAGAVSGLYWKYEQWIRNCEAAVDSPVGVYGGFYAARRALLRPAPDGTILDDMYQPLSIVRQGYRSVLDRRAVVTDRWPAQAAGEFQRKVRTLAGNFQLIALAPWMLTMQNRVAVQLISHKLLRLVVPYCFVVLLLSAAWVGAESWPYAVFAVLQAGFWIVAGLGVRWKVPVVRKAASAGGALLVLNAAAVAGLWRFLFTKGPLWKTWSPTAAPVGEVEG